MAPSLILGVIKDPFVRAFQQVVFGLLHSPFCLTLIAKEHYQDLQSSSQISEKTCLLPPSSSCPGEGIALPALYLHKTTQRPDLLKTVSFFIQLQILTQASQTVVRRCGRVPHHSCREQRLSSRLSHSRKARQTTVTVTLSQFSHQSGLS